MYYVYVISAEDRFTKIGIASNPEKRRAMLQIGCPLKLELFGKAKFPTVVIAFRVEQALHASFQDFGIHGEWFAISPRLVLMELNDRAAQDYSTFAKAKTRRPADKASDDYLSSEEYLRLQEKRARRDRRHPAA